MKTITKLLLILFLCFLIRGNISNNMLQEKKENQQQADLAQSKIEQDKNEKEQDAGDEILIDESLPLFQNLHQKKLPLMTKKEKIIWSFKLSQNRIFL